MNRFVNFKNKKICLVQIIQYYTLLLFYYIISVFKTLKLYPSDDAHDFVIGNTNKILKSYYYINIYKIFKEKIIIVLFNV